MQTLNLDKMNSIMELIRWVCDSDLKVVEFEYPNLAIFEGQGLLVTIRIVNTGKVVQLEGKQKYIKHFS